jgi:hypothetical protein
MELRFGVLAVATAAATLTGVPAHADDPLKIAFLATLSSPTSTAGPDMLDAVTLDVGELGVVLSNMALAVAHVALWHKTFMIAP